MMQIENVGVVGAGVIGVGVAQSLAESELTVLLLDRSESLLDAARCRIRSNLRLQRMLAAAAPPTGTSELLARIETSTDTERLAEVDFVIENVTESVEVKRQLYRDIDPICQERCVFAANTSAIPITRLASFTNRPARVLGIHFMNPVPMKDTVEVIRGQHTSDDTLAVARDLLRCMGKDAVVVNDAPGFVSNRVLMLMVNEAAELVEDGVASADDVDRIFVSCFGHAMGPLHTADLIGLDTVLLTLEVLHEHLEDSKFRPCSLLRRLVDTGSLGCKSGRGFFEH